MLATEVPVPKPCPASWEAMEGDTRSRACRACNKRVTDLSAITEAEARAFVAANRGACVRYTRDARGLVVHAPCERKATEIRRRRLVFGATLAGALWSGSAAAAPAARDRPDWVVWVEATVASWFAGPPVAPAAVAPTLPPRLIPEVTAPPVEARSVLEAVVLGEVARPTVVMGGMPAPQEARR